MTLVVLSTYKVILLLLIQLGLFKVVNSQAQPWNKYRGNNADSGYSSVKSSIGDNKPGIGWRFQSNGDIQSSPAFGSDGTLYFGSDDRGLYAVNGSNGYYKWRSPLAGFVQSSPAVSKDGKTVYVGSDVEDELLSNRAMTSICCFVGEGQNCNLQCPKGTVMNQLDIASFGKPQGTCTASLNPLLNEVLYTPSNNFRLNSACDSPDAEEIAADPCISQNSCSILASSLIFGDPCPGQAKSLAIKASCVTETSTGLPRSYLATPRSPKQNRLIGRIKTLPANYALTFTIMPLADTRSTLRNILHLTSTNSDDQRLPAVWFCDGTESRALQLCITYQSGVGRDLPVYATTKPLPLELWTTVTITVDLTELQRIRVQLRGGVRQSINVPILGFTPSALSFNDVSIFFSDAFYDAAMCNVKNFVINNNFDSYMYAIKTVDGSKAWSYLTQGYVISSPAIASDGTIYVGTMNNTFIALTPSGSLKWSITTGDSVQSSPAIGADGTIYVGCDDFKIYAISPAGSVVWSKSTGGWIYGSPAISADGTTVIVGSADSFLYAYRIVVGTTGFNRAVGSLRWKMQTVGALIGSPAVSGIDGSIAIGTDLGQVYYFNKNGLQQWVYDISGGTAAPDSSIYSSAVIDGNGFIYIGADNGKFYALTPAGALAWTISTQGAIQSSAAIGNDGNFYFGSGDTYMYQVGESQTRGRLATYNYTGTTRRYTVPAFTYSLLVTAYGAQAANPGLQGADARKPGMGGAVTAIIQVVPGQVLQINVGQQPTANAGGWNGGGAGRCNSGGGGGASDIQVANTSSPTGYSKIIVAGGGGGCGYYGCMGNGIGGAGGSLNAGNGSINSYIGATLGCQGLGGTQRNGGAGGKTGSTVGLSGSLGLGGNAAVDNSPLCSAGGGGGYFGGGGSAGGCGAGGGSSFVGKIATLMEMRAGVRMGHGQVIISVLGSPTSIPTRRPTRRPTSLPSPEPVAFPTPIPSPEPTSEPTAIVTSKPTIVAYCGAYTASAGTGANIDQVSTNPVCAVNICPGNQVLLTTCTPFGTCKGDTFLRLFDKDGFEVAMNDDGPGACGKCAQILYNPPQDNPCQTYTLREGCGNNGNGEDCSGTVYAAGADLQGSVLTILPTAQPTFLPTYRNDFPTPLPTPLPTFARTPRPTTAPTGASLTCAMYQDGLTNWDTTSPVTCGVSAAAGSTFTASMCQFNFPGSKAACKGNTILRLFDSAGIELTTSSWTSWQCGTCAQFSYTVPVNAPLQTYTIAEGCQSDGDCSGTVVVRGSAFKAVTFPPTAGPTFGPTFLPGRPTARPTSLPTYVPPTPMPTAELTCPAYVNSMDSNLNRNNEPTCGVTACGGQTFTVSLCSRFQGVSCKGITSLRLLDSFTRTVLATDDVSLQSAYCISDNGNNRCAQLQYTVPKVQSCRNFLIQEGCSGISACSGTIAISGVEVKLFTPIPTASPTLAPTYRGGFPTPNPTTSPTVAPTLMPTPVPTRSLTCNLYRKAKNTMTDMVDEPVCGVTACAGSPFTVSLCGSQFPGASCQGNTFLRLFDSSNSLQLAASNDPSPGCISANSQCASLTYTPPMFSGCQLYMIREGCVGDSTCSGTAKVTGALMNVITYSPTIVPSPAPSYRQWYPTPKPTTMPTYIRTCNLFNGIPGVASCGVNTCASDPITISLCPGTLPGAFCKGDTSLALVDQFNNTVAFNNNGGGTCGRCSQLTYTPPANAPCQLYTVRETCNGGTEACAGVAVISGASFVRVRFQPTIFPTFAPTYLPGTPTPDPTVRPSALPTDILTTRDPTVIPTAIPSSIPTVLPSPLPTTIPSPRPTRLPTYMPSSVMACAPYSASKTNGAQINTAACGVNACANSTFLATTCSSRSTIAACSGGTNTLLRIVNENGLEVKYDTPAAQPPSVTEGCPCGYTVQYTPKVSDGCQVFIINQGCVGDGDCQGTVAVTASKGQGVTIVQFEPTAMPTFAPTYLLQAPTPKPSPIPTWRPSRSPTPIPTLSPTGTFFKCVLYKAAATVNDGINQPVCGVTASAGQSFTVSLCGSNFKGASCSGNTFLRLFNSRNSDLLAVSDSGVGNCGECAQLTYRVPAGARTQTYIIREGCDLAGRCSGTAIIAGAAGIQLVTYAPTAMPTLQPTYMLDAPTPLPTLRPTARNTTAPTVRPTTTSQSLESAVPSNAPTPAPTFNVLRCPLFGNLWSDASVAPFPACAFILCGGKSVNITTCPAQSNAGAYCTGDVSLKLYGLKDGKKALMASNDDGVTPMCGKCPAFRFIAPGVPTVCQRYTLQEACSSDSGTCTGVANIITEPGDGTVLAAPAPSAIPTITPKTASPTFSPSYLPNVPTPLPTVNIFPTTIPTLAPTMGQFCPPYSVSHTNSAENPVQTAQCSITACFGQSVTLGSCQSETVGGFNNAVSCLGDTYLKLFESNTGSLVAEGDDTEACGTCASISFSVKTAGCSNFILRQGCYGNTACSGTTSVIGGAVVASMFPTMIPTSAPSTSPTPNPSFEANVPTPAPTIIYGTPTRMPSPKPTLPVQTCPLFLSQFTNGDTENYQACGVYACAGSKFTVSTCKRNYGGVGATCMGDTMLSLYDADDTLMIMNDDGAGDCGLCSEFTFTATAPCQTYIIREGCKGDDSCSGTAIIADQYNDMRVQSFNPTMQGSPKPSRLPTQTPTIPPTIGPTVAPTYTKGSPTPSPSSSPTNPTAIPTAVPTPPPIVPTPPPTFPLICPAYTDLSNTENALQNYAVCSIRVCPGATLTMGGCGLSSGSCTGDQYLRLYDDNQYQLAFNDDGCGKCASITYSFTEPCQNYRIVQGCYGRTTCGGVTAIVGSGIFNLVEGNPTKLPTMNPSKTLMPTYIKGRPTPSPSNFPTFLPASAPVTCALFQADSTYMDNVRFGTCGVYMCAGATVTLSLCSSLVEGATCSGDTYLKLLTQGGTLVAENGDGPAGCGSCSQITFTATAPCQEYVIAEGCVGSDDCSGTVAMRGIPGSFELATFSPTARPTSIAPTVVPSTSPTYLPDVPTPNPTPIPTAPTLPPTSYPSNPTLQPTSVPTLANYCPPFSVSRTNNALDGNYATCSIEACGGSTLTAGNCDIKNPGLGCSGDQFFRLYDSTGTNVATNDDACGLCAKVVYSLPVGAACQTFTLRQGCSGNSACAGSVAVAGGIVKPVVPSQVPSPRPSLIPTNYVANTPTKSPATTLRPSRTAAPTQQPLRCPVYAAASTNSGKINYAACGIYACAGVRFTVSTCPSVLGAKCQGDTYLQLWDKNGTMVIENDDGPAEAYCGNCAQFTYTATGPCQTYTLREGCAYNGICKGTAAITAPNNRNMAAVQVIAYSPTMRPTADKRPTPMPTALPTIAPTFGPSTSPTYLPGHPTPIPTVQPTSPTHSPTPQPSNPTANPTIAPTFALFCPPFDAKNTNNAYANYAICSFYACPGTTITVGNCQGGAVTKGSYGDVWIRLFDITGYQVSENDDACDTGAQIVYKTTQPCQVYALHQGCFGNTECGGVMQFVADAGIVLQTTLPTAEPTIQPTAMYIMGTPTLAPVLRTPMPSKPLVSVTCDLFTRDINSPSQSFPFCSFYACPGTQVTLSTCPRPGSNAYCSGGVYMKLYDSSNSLMSVNVGGPGAAAGCGGCPEIIYSTTGQCQLYTIKEGCQGKLCAGSLTITGQVDTFELVTNKPTSAPAPHPTIPPIPLPTPLPTTVPTASPTAMPDEPTMVPSAYPTANPTIHPSGPTFLPTPSLSFCPPYTAVNTSSGKVLTSLCTVQACPGEKLVIGSCFKETDTSHLSVCYGDQFLRLQASNGLEVGRNDDSCGMCSQIVYQVPTTATTCDIYTIHEGCFGNAACSGVVSVMGGTLSYIPGTPTLQPSLMPTPQPSSHPTFIVTPSPSNDPTPEPSTAPSAHPTELPSISPTPEPTFIPSVQPSMQPSTPTYEPSALPTTGPGNPSNPPTEHPSALPSAVPSSEPTTTPSAEPTSLPTELPSENPTPLPTREPTPIPSSHPSPEPTHMPSPVPTMIPSVFAPVQSGLPTTELVMCPTYEAVDTNSGLDHSRTVDCSIRLCGGTNILFSNCPKRGYGAMASGATTMALWNAAGEMVAGNYDGTDQINFQCDPNQNCDCSEIYYSTPMDSACQTYALEQGCHENSFCGGKTILLGVSGAEIIYNPPSALPTALPTASPSALPTRMPSAHPTVRPSTLLSAKPTPKPSPRPSSRPTVQPSPKPSILPTPRPSKQGESVSPSPRPSMFRSSSPTMSSAPTLDYTGSDIFKLATNTPTNPNPIWGDTPTGNAWGTVVAWNGMNLLASASANRDDDGSLEVFSCSENSGVGDSGPTVECSFVSLISGPEGSKVEFGWDVTTAGRVVAVSSPGILEVEVYDIADVLQGTTHDGARVDPLARIACPNRNLVSSEFGRTIALCALPGWDNPDVTGTAHKGMILAVSDEAFVNNVKDGTSTGKVYIYVSLSDATTWELKQSISSPSLASLSLPQDKYFGSKIAISSLGVLAVGVGGSGAVYIYDCDFHTYYCSMFKQKMPIKPPSPLTLNSEFHVEYSLAINKDTLLIGQPSAFTDSGVVYVYGLVNPTGMPTPQPTVAPSRGASLAPTGFFDEYSFSLVLTLRPDPIDTNHNFSAYFGANMAINDNAIIAIGAPGGADGWGTTYMYHCGIPGQCHGKDGHTYFQKMDCFGRHCEQGLDYYSAMALSATGALLAKGNEGATLGTDTDQTDNGNIEIWFADNRIPMTFAPTAEPSQTPTPAPSILPTPNPSSSDQLTTPAPTSQTPFNSSFTVLQALSGPSISQKAIDAGIQSVKQVLKITISKMYGNRVLAAAPDQGGNNAPLIGPDWININWVRVVNQKRSLAGESLATAISVRDPLIRRSLTTSTMWVNYTVTFDYIKLGFANEGYVAAFDHLVTALRKEIGPGTAVTDSSSRPPLKPSFPDESYFTQMLRLNAPDGSLLKSAESDYTITEPKFISGIQAQIMVPSMQPPPVPSGEPPLVPSMQPPPVPTLFFSEAPSASSELSELSENKTVVKSNHNIPMIAGIAVGAFFLVLFLLYFFRKMTNESNDKNESNVPSREEDYHFQDNDSVSRQSINPIYNNNAGPSRIEFGNDRFYGDDGSLRRVSEWNGSATNPIQEQQPPDYLDQNNPGFKLVQPGGFSSRGSVAPRLSLSQQQNPNVPPALLPFMPQGGLMSPPTMPQQPIGMPTPPARLGAPIPPGQIAFGLPANLPPSTTRLGAPVLPNDGRLKPFTPQKPSFHDL